MATIANRIKKALDLRNMKQVDLVNKTKIGKSSISTYISGDYEPKQKNIYKIAEALNVSEAWLMGYDVPMERESVATVSEMPETERLLSYYAKLNDLGKKEANKRVEELTQIGRYRKEQDHLVLNAAHELEGATDEDKKHDDDIMDDENF